MKVSKVIGSGNVYGITVPTGVFRVRRNGKECWTGNSGRDVGRYTQEDQPAKGGKTGAKRFGNLDINGLLAHSATEVIKDAQLVRGTKNEDFWNAMKLGRPLPKPGVPFVYNKFTNLMKAGGINISRNGDAMDLLPMTNSAISKLSSGEITASDTVKSDTMAPVRGGLFDENVTGGTTGNRWGHITLADPMPNPVMEEPIRRLLNLKKKDYIDVISGKQAIDGKTGGIGITEALENINVDHEIEKYRGEISTSRGARRDNAIKALRYLTSMKKQGLKPSDWMIDKVPVLPPKFRPISRMGDVLLVSDMNDLYRDVLEMNNSVKELSSDLDPEDVADEKANLYNAVSAAFGVTDSATTEGRSKRLKGAMRQVIGTNPKRGLFQNKVMSKNVDMVGRAVIAPDPNLDMDSIGIPEKQAWNIYKPFIYRKLVRRGYPPVKVKELIENRSKEADQALDEVMAEKPVVANRAPSWHKFNLLSFRPYRVKDDVIRVSPLIVAGFNADFDGDTMNFHVPVTDKASKEAWQKMRPSKNLFRVTDLGGTQHTPSKEMVMGLHQLTQAPSSKPPVVFATKKEAREAYNHGLISINDPIVIKGK